MSKAALQTSTSGEAGFIDEKELLQRLPISRRTAFSWEKDGKLPVVKIGRRKLYHWKSVSDALLRQQRGGGE
jgi:predicted site-specific integrase-resolvase